MTQTRQIPKDVPSTQAAETASVFIPLLLCFAGSTALAFLLAPLAGDHVYSLSRPPSADTVYGMLSQTAQCLGSVILQTGLIFASALLLYPSFLTVPVTLWRGLCMGFSLWAVSEGRIEGLRNPAAALFLTFPATVLLLLAASLAHRCGHALREAGMFGGRREANDLMFTYIRFFLILSGAIFALSEFAILLS